MTRVLVAGVGNVLLHDDGFGVEVVRRLLREAVPANVNVVDFGIRALHLAYELLEGYDMLVIVDAMSRGDAPGTVFVFEPDPVALAVAPTPETAGTLDPHGIYPGAVLRMALDLGASIGTVRVVGCEPADLEEGIGLSPAVERAVDRALRVVRDLVHATGTGVTKKEDDHVEEEEAT